MDIRLAAVGLSLAMAGATPDSWGQTRTEELMPIERTASAVVDLGSRSIASLRLSNGNTVDFLDLLDGHVGVGETAKRGQTASSTHLASGWAATPLEIFLALAPTGSAVPQALQTDHDDYAARTGRSAAPRDLTIYLTQPGGNGVSDLLCGEQGTFYNDWYDAFEGVTDYVIAAAGHFLSGQWTFYAGKHVYEGTNTNSVTYLGACHDHAFDGQVMAMEAHRRIKTVNNGVTTYTWVKVAEAGLHIDEMYVFYSNFPASYRGRVKSTTAAAIDHYTVAAAYTKTPGIKSNY